MEIQGIEHIIASLAIDLVEYEDGDLMLMSDLIDKINSIAPEFGESSRFAIVCARIQELLMFLLHGGEYLKVNILVSQGIDLAARMVRDIKRNKKTVRDGYDGNLFEKFEEEIREFAETARKGLQDLLVKKRNNESAVREKEEIGIRISSEPFRVFLSEANGKVLEAQDLILKLEDSPADKELINHLFRIFHTLKGECGFLRISNLGELSHNLENMLDLVRNESLKVNDGIIDILLSGIDYTRHMIDALRHNDIVSYSSIDVSDFISQVNEQTHIAKSNIGEILVARGKLSDADLETILRIQKEQNFTKKFGEIAVAENYITQDELNACLEDQKKPAVAKEHAAKQADSIIKVKASQINFLVDMVGELIISQAQLNEKTDNLGQLKKITKEIQFATMQLRTEKVRNLFIDMKRLVRDVSRKLGKRALAVVRGEDLEIDRDLVEKLEEPLMHIIRNSIAHGLESGEERMRSGKPVSGNIKIEAERRGNTIVISVEDDGRGLDRKKILKQAVKRNIIGKEATTKFSDFEIYNFIFEQGFSTAETVDAVSGRGVGMDIVKTVAESARGRVAILTEPGKFTRIEMIFPLSTAIIDGMIVKNKGTHFIIPVSNIIETLNLEQERIFTVKDNVKVIDIRSEIIPVIMIEEFFAQDGLLAGAGTGRLLAVIVENNEKKKYALVLDDIIAKREVFIKSLGAKFRNLPGISSGTILHGGTIGFVLDIDQISKGVETITVSGQVHA